MKDLIPLKIMYVYYHMAYTGGVVRVLSDKMNYLSEHGYEITLVTYEQGEHPLIFALNPNIHYYDTQTPLFPLYKYHYFTRLYHLYRINKVFTLRLKSIIDKTKPNIIITVAGDHMSCNAVAKINSDAKKIIESHSINFETMNGVKKGKNNILQKLYEIFDKRTISNFDALVALTQGSAKEWKIIIPLVFVIPNPITQYPENIPEPTIHKRIIAVGRLDFEKGFDRLVTAFSLISEEIQDWKLDIYGEGKEKEKLLSLIQSNTLADKIEIHQPTSDIYNEYMRSDFCVVSSYYEGWGLVLVEAMSCGIPCVSFNCKYGPQDIIKDKENGLLAINNDINDLSKKMLWMCQHQEERIQMGQKAREDMNHYKKDIIMHKWEQLFRNITEQ